MTDRNSRERQSVARKHEQAMTLIAGARSHAEGSADVLKGIPAFAATWDSFVRIADRLERAEELLRAEAFDD